MERRGVAAVDARTASTLPLKKAAKSSAVLASVSAVEASPNTLLKVRHVFLESPLPAAIYHSASSCCCSPRTDASPSVCPSNFVYRHQNDCSVGIASPQLSLDIQPLGSRHRITVFSTWLCGVPSRSDNDGRVDLPEFGEVVDG